MKVVFFSFDTIIWTQITVDVRELVDLRLTRDSTTVTMGWLWNPRAKEYGLRYSFSPVLNEKNYTNCHKNNILPDLFSFNCGLKDYLIMIKLNVLQKFDFAVVKAINYCQITVMKLNLKRHFRSWGRDNRLVINPSIPFISVERQRRKLM